MIERRLSPKTTVAAATAAARDTLLPPPHSAFAKAIASAAETRIACILVADFPLAAAIRQSPELRDRPLVLIESGGRRNAAGVANMECRFVSAHARAMGVRAGMTVARARAAAAGLAVMSRSPAAEASAAEALVDGALSFSPLVEAGDEGEVYLDLGGLERLHQRLRANSHRKGARAATSASEMTESPAEVTDAETIETGLAQEALGRVARLGMDAAVGIASSKEVALLAARCGGARAIAAGREEEFLNWLPLDLLKLDGAASGGGRDGAELEQTLARWGIRRLGELARLDIRAVGSRLGARAVELIRIARGECRTPLIARRAAENFAEAVELEWGVDSLEAMGFVMRAMIERVVERLQLRGLAAGEIALALELEGRRRDVRRVALPAPTNEARTLLALILLNLESAPPAAAVEAIRITVEPRAPRAAQADMFAPPCPAPERLHVTLARLAALCGPGKVGTLMPRNSHLPDAVELGPFAPRPTVPPAPALAQNSTREMDATKSPAAGAVVAQLAIRAVRPPHQVEVLCPRGDAPEFVRGADFGGRVVSCAGPWRIAAAPSHSGNSGGDCPQGAPGAARDYYDVALEDGGVYRLLCDLRSGEWYVDGIYD